MENETRKEKKRALVGLHPDGMYDNGVKRTFIRCLESALKDIGYAYDIVDFDNMSDTSQIRQKYFDVLKNPCYGVFAVEANLGNPRDSDDSFIADLAFMLNGRKCLAITGEHELAARVNKYKGVVGIPKPFTKEDIIGNALSN